MSGLSDFARAYVGTVLVIVADEERPEDGHGLDIGTRVRLLGHARQVPGAPPPEREWRCFEILDGPEAGDWRNLDARDCGQVPIVSADFAGPFLVDAASVVENECSMKEVTQKSVALTYALALRAEAIGGVKADWKRINRAILDRWSVAGLDRVKTRAWKIVEGKIQP